MKAAMRIHRMTSPESTDEPVEHPGDDDHRVNGEDRAERDALRKSRREQAIRGGGRRGRPPPPSLRAGPYRRRVLMCWHRAHPLPGRHRAHPMPGRHRAHPMPGRHRARWIRGASRSVDGLPAARSTARPGSSLAPPRHLPRSLTIQHGRSTKYQRVNMKAGRRDAEDRTALVAPRPLRAPGGPAGCRAGPVVPLRLLCRHPVAGQPPEELPLSATSTPPIWCSAWCSKSGRWPPIPS